MKFVWAFLIIVVVIGGAYFLLAKNTAQNPTMQPATQKAQPTSSPSAMMQNITVEGTEFAFTPSSITVKKGEEVQVTFKNMGKYPHNFTVSQLGVASQTIQPGQQTTVTFTPTQTGTFTYLCTVPGHADRGMTGTLTVQ